MTANTLDLCQFYLVVMSLRWGFRRGCQDRKLVWSSPLPGSSV